MNHLTRTAGGALALCLAAGLALSGCGSQSAAGGRDKVYLDLSASGNNWQDEAANLAQSVVTSPQYAGKYQFKKVISGTDVQKQASDIQSMIGGGARLIVVNPASPTALNPVIEQGCKAGVTIVAYDATVTAPCAYNVETITGTKRDDKTKAFFGAQSAQYIVDQLGGKGNLVINRGVVGNSVDKTHYDTAMQVFKQYPGIHIVAEFQGQWNASVSQQAMSKVLASHPDVDAVWSQDGEVGVIKALQAAGKKAVLSGNSSAYFIKMLANGGWKGVASSAPPSQGGIAMKVGLQLLEKGAGGMPKNIEVHLPWVTQDTAKKCRTTSFTDGCNYFDGVDDTFIETISDSDLFPEATLDAAKKGTPLGKVTPLPDMKAFAQPPERRIYTRARCDSGYVQGPVQTGQTPAGLNGCNKQ